MSRQNRPRAATLGVAPNRNAISFCDFVFDRAYHREMADVGCYTGFRHRLLDAGLSLADIDRLLYDNPRRAFIGR